MGEEGEGVSEEMVDTEVQTIEEREKFRAEVEAGLGDLPVDKKARYGLFEKLVGFLGGHARAEEKRIKQAVGEGKEEEEVVEGIHKQMEARKGPK